MMFISSLTHTEQHTPQPMCSCHHHPFYFSRFTLFSITAISRAICKGCRHQLKVARATDAVVKVNDPYFCAMFGCMELK